MPDTDVGKRLRMLREARGLTQKEAAVNQIEKKQRLELQRCGRGKSKKINTEMNN